MDEDHNHQETRFAFGANWAKFLSVLDDERIRTAETSLKMMLGAEDLRGKTFLDIGSGSGLFSLAARRLGAKVHSFDYDAQSVACTVELKRRYFPGDAEWEIERGSALDANYMNRLGRFDVVYSWGVLHHTGAMWLGFELALKRVVAGGKLFIAIYNDQGWKSHLWWLIELVYNKLPRPIDRIYAYVFGTVIEIINIGKYAIKLKPMTAIKPLISYKNNRGMSRMHDMVDLIGGFPFEFATYDVLQDYFSSRGFVEINGRRATSLGCHELVFRLPDSRTNPIVI